MKILVFSDSHNKVHFMNIVIEKLKDCIDTIIHLGDGWEDLVCQKSKLKNVNMYFVSGNCDFNREMPKSNIFFLNGKKIFMTHGDNYSVKTSYDRICYAAAEDKAHICLFGHTHIPTIFNYENILIMNPGSISLPKSQSSPTYGVLDISDDGIITPSIVLVDSDGNCKLSNL